MFITEDRSEIFKALIKFRTIVKQPKKEADNPFFKSKYVNLEGVCNAIDTAISEGKLGIGYIQEATSEGNQVSVTTHIIHDSGQYITFEQLNIPVSKNDAQAFGSALTYAKRYALSTAFGVTSEVDDDGDRAVESPTQDRPKNNKASSKQIGLLKVKVTEYCNLKNGNKAEFEDYLAKKYRTQSIYTCNKHMMSQIIDFITKQLEQA